MNACFGIQFFSDWLNYILVASINLLYGYFLAGYLYGITDRVYDGIKQ